MLASREKLTGRIAEAMRDVIANAVLTNERIARSFGINVVDLQTLGVIMRAQRGLTPSDIAQLTEQPTSSVTRVLDRLETAGFVHREPDPSDRRRTIIHPDAQRLLAAEDNPYAAVMDGLSRLHADFSPNELEIVARYLEATASERTV
jgi:DNA-binding MarR family transcriptional regulator